MNLGTGRAVLFPQCICYWFTKRRVDIDPPPICSELYPAPPLMPFPHVSTNLVDKEAALLNFCWQSNLGRKYFLSTPTCKYQLHVPTCANTRTLARATPAVRKNLQSTRWTFDFTYCVRRLNLPAATVRIQQYR
jgi:hypothetical protein